MKFLLFRCVEKKSQRTFTINYPYLFFFFNWEYFDSSLFYSPLKLQSFKFFSKRFSKLRRRKRVLFKRKRRSLKRRSLRFHKSLCCLPFNTFQSFSSVVLSRQSFIFTSFFFLTLDFLKRSYYQFNIKFHQQKLPILYQLAFQSFLKSFFHQSIKLRFFDTTSAINSHFLQVSLQFFQNELRGKNRFLYLIEVVDILLVALHQKNAPLFLWWVKKTFESWDFKQFNLLFLFLKVVLGYAELHILKLFFLRGIFIKFKGKLQKGASRKRKRILQFGTISLTSKSLKISASCCQIRTLSGSIGCNLRIFY